MMGSLLVRLPSGRTRCLDAERNVRQQLEALEGLPPSLVRLVGDARRGVLDVRLRLLGGGGDQVCT